MIKFFPLILVGLFFVFPNSAYAHAFGKLYNLPVPFWLYLYGGAATIIVSFLIIGYFFNKTKSGFSYPTINLSKSEFLAIFISSEFKIIWKIITLILFILAIISGLIGSESSYQNFNMTFFWITFLLGFTYLTAILGNFYSAINPWKTLVEVFEGLTKQNLKGVINYPKKLAYWPALIFYTFLIWVELLGEATPFTLSTMLVGYSVISFLGIYLFGKNTYFKYADIFEVFFKLISKIAPIEVTGNKLYLRPPFIGLLKTDVSHFSLLVFILFMLSSTAFDGFRETTPWVKLYVNNFNELLNPIFGANSSLVFQNIGIWLTLLFFLVIYLFLIALTKIITGSKLSINKLALMFGYSLVPIAFVYNFAHYYTLLLTQGQEIIRLISDPFGFGWNLFATSDYLVDLSFIDANITWHTQVATILIGHIAGVLLAHITALRVFPDQKQALISQIPMLILMVIYTMIGLWILSQPITSGL
jgi:hypothetical protein